MRLSKILLLPLLMVSCVSKSDSNFWKVTKYKVENTCIELKSKHETKESDNLYGSFRNVYYFLYVNGEVEEVELKTYMSFDEGDDVCLSRRIKYYD